MTAPARLPEQALLSGEGVAEGASVVFWPCACAGGAPMRV